MFDDFFLGKYNKVQKSTLTLRFLILKGNNKK